MKKKNYYLVSDMAISAGGVLFYNTDGIYVIKEENIDHLFLKQYPYKYNDPGGKYTFEDTDIDICIAREFNEETYYAYYDLFNILVIKNLYKEKKITNIYIKANKWIYKCILIDIKYLNITYFDNKKFFIKRLTTLNYNKSYPYYTSLEYILLPYKNIKGNKYLSSRLIEILSHSKFSCYL